MTILTSLPYYFLLSAILVTGLATQISRRLNANLDILWELGTLLLFAFIGMVIFDLVYYLARKKPVDVWKLGWLGILGIFGLGINPAYSFYTFFLFFGFKKFEK